MSERLKPKPVARRDFLSIAGLGTLALAGVGALAGMVRLLKPYVLPEPMAKFRLGRPDEFPPGTVRVVPERSIYVISEPKGVAVISMVCTHLGCIVSPADKGFDCPCHGSRFDPRGKVLRGPAPRALLWLEVTQAADGSLMVDANREVKPNTWYRG
jgi:cytochrome b6-f complex iron-sulfur subunit